MARNAAALRGYLLRRAEALMEIVDTSRVYGKRYNAAVDELEEVEELLTETNDRASPRERANLAR